MKTVGKRIEIEGARFSKPISRMDDSDPRVVLVTQRGDRRIRANRFDRLLIGGVDVGHVRNVTIDDWDARGRPDGLKVVTIEVIASEVAINGRPWPGSCTTFDDDASPPLP